MFKLKPNFLFTILLFSILFFLAIGITHAAGDYTAQKPIERTIHLGNKNNDLRFYPNSLEFETGKLYKLIIRNPSKQKHYFSAEAFSRSVFTRKVQVISKLNKTLAEVKGVISEIEVYPSGITEWWFVPIKTLNASALHCSIKGHTEAGMTGSITIK